MTSFTPINTYLIEGVIATIEVKSNLSTGSPNGLAAAFKGVQGVRSVDLDRDQPQIVLCEGDTFAVFLRHLLRAVLLSTGGLVAEFPGIEAKLLYGLEHYFELRPRVECKRVPPERPNRV